MTVFAVVNWIASLIMAPWLGLANGPAKLRVMSSYSELRAQAAINEVHLPKVS